MNTLKYCVLILLLGLLMSGWFVSDVIRKKCDYEGDHTITRNNAEKLVVKAKKVIAIIDDLES